jgi:DNA polymerase III subunit alpha
MTKLLIPPPKKFVGLHAHSGAGSPYDGLGYPSQHMDFVLSNGMDAWCLTDHGNGNGLAHAHAYAKKLKKKGVNYRQLYGVEFYFVPSLDLWRSEYDAHRTAVRNAKTEKAANSKADIESEDEISGGLVIENEEETKSEFDTSNWKRRYHLVVFAKNQKGLQNLFTLVKRSYSEGFYRFPRIDYKMLKEHGEGLIVSTACIGGFPAGIIARGEAFKKSHKEIVLDLENMSGRFIDAVGEGNFNLEMQFNSLKMQHTTNKYLIDLHRKTNIPLVATADSHYYSRDMWEARELYRKLGRMGSRGEKQQTLPQFEDLKCELYPKNAGQMWDEYLKHYDSYDFYKGSEQIVSNAIERTHDIAWGECNEIWFNEEAKLPDFSTPEKSAMAQLSDRVRQALIEEDLHKDKVYVDRAVMELDDIKHLGFENYFLTMTKVFDIAAESTILGPGRGSGAGSLVNYLLGITTTDPIKYGLLWERFLHRKKAGWPDIDTDAGDRDVLIDAAKTLVGEDSVVPVSNFNTLKLKSLVKDVAKFYGIDFGEINSITAKLQEEVMHKAMGDHEEKSTYVLTHEDCMKYSEKYKEFMESYPKVCEQVQSLFMENRSIGRHAGGVLICPNLEKHMPVIKVRGELQTPWSEGMNFRHLEPNGFLKFDFLGLTTLKMVEDCIRLILRQKNPGKKINFFNIKKFFDEKLNCRFNDLNDPEVWKYIYEQGNFVQIFQFTQQGARNFCKEAKPTSIAELAAITAIYRPGPLAANVHRKYVKAKNNPQDIVYDHDTIREILEESFGFTVFQEQFMLLAQKLAGFDKGESDKMRKTLVKKSLDANDAKVKERVDLREKFVSGAMNLSGLSESKATKLYETIEAFSAYGFNKSHAVSYAIDSYYSAWLHTHYEKEWLATCLQTLNGSNKFSKIISEIKSMGYRVLAIDINESSDTWVYSEKRKGFVPPLTAIKGIGSAAVDEIIEKRPFNSVYDLLYAGENWKPKKINKTCLDAICRVEGLNSLVEFENGTFKNHRQLHEILMSNYNNLRKSIYGLTKTAVKKLAKEGIEPERFIDTQLESVSGLEDWNRVEKIHNFVNLMESVDKSIVFPEEIMAKINRAGIKSFNEIEEGQKDIGWFCIQELIKKETKNGKTFYRAKVCDYEMNSSWVRIWTAFKQEPSTYTMWLSELSNSGSWGLSTSSYKMRKIEV